MKKEQNQINIRLTNLDDFEKTMAGFANVFDTLMAYYMETNPMYAVQLLECLYHYYNLLAKEINKGENDE